MNRTLVAALAMACVVGACTVGQPSTGPLPPVGPLTIYAASSLQPALEEAEALWEQGHTGSTLTFSFDSSAALETKIEQGAPADVFLSADTTNPKKLLDAGFASGDPQDFATNALTIIVPVSNPAHIASPFDLAKPGVRVVAAADSVPIAAYATQLVQNLARLPGAPAGFEAAYAANVITKADNVRAVVSHVELGEGDAAIVYASDADASGHVGTVAITPDSANVVATYAGVVVKASARQAAAQAFLEWLTGPIGQAVLASHGFLPSPA